MLEIGFFLGFIIPLTTQLLNEKKIISSFCVLTEPKARNRRILDPHTKWSDDGLKKILLSVIFSFHVLFSTFLFIHSLTTNDHYQIALLVIIGSYLSRISVDIEFMKREKSNFHRQAEDYDHH